MRSEVTESDAGQSQAPPLCANAESPPGWQILRTAAASQDSVGWLHRDTSSQTPANARHQRRHLAQPPCAVPPLPLGRVWNETEERQPLHVGENVRPNESGQLRAAQVLVCSAGERPRRCRSPSSSPADERLRHVCLGNQRVCGVSRHAARVTHVARHTEVAALPPVGGPRVFDLPARAQQAIASHHSEVHVAAAGHVIMRRNHCFQGRLGRATERACHTRPTAQSRAQGQDRLAREPGTAPRLPPSHQ